MVFVRDKTCLICLLRLASKSTLTIALLRSQAVFATMGRRVFTIAVLMVATSVCVTQSFVVGSYLYTTGPASLSEPASSSNSEHCVSVKVRRLMYVAVDLFEFLSFGLPFLE